MWFFIIGIVAIFGLVYYWFVSKYKHFEELGIPFSKPKFPFGNLPSTITQNRNMTYDFDDMYQEFRGRAPFIGFFEVKSPGIMLIDPEAVKSVLVKNFKNFHDNEFSKMTDKEKDPIFGRNPFMLRGEEWKEKRAEITPAFTPNRIKALFPLVEEITDRLTHYITDELRKDNVEPFDAREICAKYTTDVVSSCIFNADAKSFSEEKSEIREMGRKIMQPDNFLTFVFILFAIIPSLMKVYKVKMVAKEIEDFFTNLMHQAIEHREKNKINRDDYLAFLMGMRNKKQFSELDMAAHGVTFFIDGFETSSLAIASALYELGHNPKVQEKLRKELESIYDDNGKVVYEKLIEHDYLDQVFYEALRLHPPATITNRECTEAIELEGLKGKKYQMKVGDGVMIPIYSIHRDPDYYPEPEKFYPERFDAEHGGVKAFKDKGVLLPFGDGPRICLGIRFATMQSKAAIAGIVKNFKISVNDKTQHPLVLAPKEFLNVKVGGLWLDFKPVKCFY